MFPFLCLPHSKPWQWLLHPCYNMEDFSRSEPMYRFSFSCLMQRFPSLVIYRPSLLSAPHFIFRGVFHGVFTSHSTRQSLAMLAFLAHNLATTIIASSCYSPAYLANGIRIRRSRRTPCPWWQHQQIRFPDFMTMSVGIKRMFEPHWNPSVLYLSRLWRSGWEAFMVIRCYTAC